jgi:hypothetical protein
MKKKKELSIVERATIEADKLIHMANEYVQSKTYYDHSQVIRDAFIAGFYAGLDQHASMIERIIHPKE